MERSDEHTCRRPCHILYLDNYAEPSKIFPFLPASQASLTINGETIRRCFARRLRQAASSQLPCKNQMDRNTFRSINWDVRGKALGTLENSANIFIVRFSHGHLPTWRHMHRTKRAVNDICPACIHIAKTEWHTLSCPSESLWWGT